MKVTLIDFQEEKLDELREYCNDAQAEYGKRGKQQIISLTAPTGAGKTILMSALIESVMCGNEKYVAQPDSVFIWLSDMPDLNEQSKQKIMDETENSIGYGNFVTIKDEEFDQEILNDGVVYFLNTQKLGINSNLTKKGGGDKRQFTIWQTLQNTIREKGNRLYLIIDEAHRGSSKQTDIEKANTIMQKFIKGSEDDGLDRLPMVIGMSATIERFNKLVAGITSATTRSCEIEAKDVIESGLLKDNIEIEYPAPGQSERVMTMLQLATREWIHKCEHWQKHHERNGGEEVNPIFTIQVENKGNDSYSVSDLDECLRVIESELGRKLERGEVVHSFGNPQTEIKINNLIVPYLEASRIQDSDEVKIVFFKESLSTGWDCPRAETMMSFRVATDYTYIAQLVGRIVRTPLHRRIEDDVTLNDVHLFLPRFDEETVKKVVASLRSEGVASGVSTSRGGDKEYQTLYVAEDKRDVLEWINSMGLLTYVMSSSKISSYLNSVYKLANLIKNETPDKTVKRNLTKEIVNMMCSYVEKLQASGAYEEKIKSFDEYIVNGGSLAYLRSEEMEGRGSRIWRTLDYDIEREYKLADHKLAQGEIATDYLAVASEHYDIMECEKQVVLFVNNCLDELESYAKERFKELKKNYRKVLTTRNEVVTTKYERIVKQNPNPESTWKLHEPFILPKGEVAYKHHLFVDANGEATFNFTSGWESKLLEAEFAREDFVCWIRNVEGRQAPLTLIRKEGKQEKKFIPDFIVIRKENGSYTFNILEPHRANEADNYSKAEAMVNYAKKESQVDDIELIRIERDDKIVRLDFNDEDVIEEMAHVNDNAQLTALFKKMNE